MVAFSCGKATPEQQSCKPVYHGQWIQLSSGRARVSGAGVPGVAVVAEVPLLFAVVETGVTARLIQGNFVCLGGATTTKNSTVGNGYGRVGNAVPPLFFYQ